MIIDFHTHIFPEKLAARTLPWIKEISGVQYQLKGTGEDLRRSMDACGIDLCVTMPIVTRAGTMRKINDYAAEQAKKWGFLSFGSVHPDEPDWRGELRRFRELGLRGLKLHNDYQKFYFDSRECRQIIEAAFEEGLPVLVHPGIDPVSPDVHYCTSKMLKDAMPLLRQGTFIATHLGGHMRLEEAMEYVIGSDIYLDVSMARVYYAPEACKKAILNHDPDKLLFGTDSPWDNQAGAIQAIRDMELGEELTEKILGGNAQRLLGLS
ncbi:MAG: amidohydrolase family protein [Oscillospiraceae bacterium]|nr:amidohydrolase family protein [Oscillospiraceae bacterium]